MRNGAAPRAATQSRARWNTNCLLDLAAANTRFSEGVRFTRTGVVLFATKSIDLVISQRVVAEPLFPSLSWGVTLFAHIDLVIFGSNRGYFLVFIGVEHYLHTIRW